MGGMFKAFIGIADSEGLESFIPEGEVPVEWLTRVAATAAAQEGGLLLRGAQRTRRPRRSVPSSMPRTVSMLSASSVDWPSSYARPLNPGYCCSRSSRPRPRDPSSASLPQSAADLPPLSLRSSTLFGRRFAGPCPPRTRGLPLVSASPSDEGGAKLGIAMVRDVYRSARRPRGASKRLAGRVRCDVRWRSKGGTDEPGSSALAASALSRRKRCLNPR